MTDSPSRTYVKHDEGARARFRPLIFGEALFDHFPDGTRILGGAPFNVAWHLRGFKGDPLVVTAVGHDAEGKEILERMGSWGMDTAGVQLHPTRPTGRVTAHLRNGQPRYQIEPGQAYDAVSVDGLPDPDTLSRADLLYHGTLGLRESVSRRALSYLKEDWDHPVFVDVNLRDPWWSTEVTPGQIRGSDWVKVNQEEAGLLSGRPVSTTAALLDAAHSLKTDLNLGTLVVTRGQEGVLAVSDDGVVQAEAPRVEDVVDTVGAGDGFSAVLALGIHQEWPISLTLQRAAQFAGELCRIRGAIPQEAGLYSRYLRRWNHAH